MKKKLFLAFVMTFAFAMVLAFAVSAESVHNENTVDYGATVTLDDGTVLPLYDESRNSLIWYTDGKDEEGKTKYSSVRADDSARVHWQAEGWDEVRSWGAYLEDGTTSIKSKIVVINLMDDDVVRNTGTGSYLGKPMDNFKQLFEGMKLLEYCYLRLDTKTINTNSFNGCSKLKYINLENLTQLKRMAQNSQFSGCSRLFDGEVLDLTRTQLYEFEGSSTFSGVPFKGVKFPETMVKIGSNTTFNNCTNLEFVSIGSKAVFYGTPFSGCTSLKAIYYVGTLEQLNKSTISSMVENPTVKSYAEYKALADKSGVYIVYDYSRCEAFNRGIHGEATPINKCVGICNVCSEMLVNHMETENIGVTIAYSNYALAGEKVTDCQNEGCTYHITTEAPALFTCLGYSAPENGDDGISIKYTVNGTAIAEYERVTGATLSYGMFATTKQAVGNGYIFDADGNTVSGAITLDVTKSGFTFLSLKMVGFDTEESKAVEFAIGAYAVTTQDGKKSYSYIQEDTPLENQKYAFIKYSDYVK